MKDNLPVTDISQMEFRIYSDSEIEKISVMKITTEEALNKLGHCNKGGLYDLRLGPMAKASNEKELCDTCMQTSEYCMGHSGHIDLSLPVFNPLLVHELAKLLRYLCLGCGNFLVGAKHILLLNHQCRLLDKGYSCEAVLAEDIKGDHVQIKIDVDGNEQPVTVDAVLPLELLQKKYDDHYKSVLQADHRRGESVHTSCVRTVRAACRKKFLNKFQTKKFCDKCKYPTFTVNFKTSQMILSVADAKLREKLSVGSMVIDTPGILNLIFHADSVLSPLQAQDLLRVAWRECSSLMCSLYAFLSKSNNEHPSDAFFINKLLVIPPKYRPLVFLRDSFLEHESSVLLKNVLRLCRCLQFLAMKTKQPEKELPVEIALILAEIPGQTDAQKMDKLWQLLQGSVDNLLDANSNKEVNQTQKGIKQLFEKKAGLFRSNLMGKRVNFSARSVLAPDPALAVDEVGVPRDFAEHLHYPVPVTPWNVAYLRKLVMNGPNKYPGAHMVEDEDGNITKLAMLKEGSRLAVAKKLLTPPDSTMKMVNPSKIVYRQLQDGDMVLMNRQPTLHRPSIQAHKARVMKTGDRVLRMPYANCKAYNADFDGDEMNLHFPQNEMARSEAFHLVTTHNQYLTPKDGAPLAGLVQDCVVAGVMLSMRGTFFNKEDYIQMVNVSLQDHAARVITVVPAIIKPTMLWSGKQVFTTILQNLIPCKTAFPTFEFKTSVKVDMWQTEPSRLSLGGHRWGATSPDAMSESEFLMREGELLQGVVDKSAIGSTSHGLIHVCYDLYGGHIAAALLTAFNRLCMYYLQLHGHTISSKEFLTPHSVAQTRRDKLNTLVRTAPKTVLEKLEMDEEQFRQFWESNHVNRCQKNLALIDAAYTQVLGKTTSQVTTENEQGLFRRTIDNSMRLMVDSGAKGSKVNMNQMASLFGPTAIDGKRMPLSLSGKTLPSFPPYDMNPKAGGYINTRFMTGMDPQSYFFLCIVGRDSLQHTAVKTANSGYMQRCLIKHLEGIQVKYDMTVRNSDGLVLQFEYGEDGLDVTKIPFLRTCKTLDVVVDNYSRILNPKIVNATKERSATREIHKRKKRVKKWLKNYGSVPKCMRRSGFTLFCEKEKGTREGNIDSMCGRSEKSLKLQRQWRQLESYERQSYISHAVEYRPPQPNPILTLYNGHDTLGAVSEKLDQLIDSYYDSFYSARDSHHKMYNKEEIQDTVSMKVLKSHVDPGEAVGAICAQAIGEPLTQMTLNTFHFAGRDELNVTLGVPRMVEILRTASATISTPIMEIPFLPGVTIAVADTLKKKFTEVTLKQVLHTMEAECIEVNRRSSNEFYSHLVKLRFTLLPTSHYRQELPVTTKDVLRFMEKHYLYKGIVKRLDKKGNLKAPVICSVLEVEKAHRVRKQEAVEEANIKANEQEDEDAEDEDLGSVNGDDDNAEKARRGKQSEQDYDDDEEREDELEEDEGIDEDLDSDQLASDADNEDREINADEYKSKKLQKQNSRISESEVLKRRNAVKSLDERIINYEFDTVDELWCEMTLAIPNIGVKYDFKSIVSSTVGKAYVYRIPGIKRAFVEEKSGNIMLRTEGVNIYKIVEWANYLDINRLYTNDLQLVCKTLGIEATQRSIIKEIRAVQTAYNITVDYRHLTLLADYFTWEGVYKACNRGALSSCTSTLQQMSYESTLMFLKTALIENATDRMQSPSARVATGQVVTVGTNVMDIMIDISAGIKKEKF